MRSWRKLCRMIGSLCLDTRCTIPELWFGRVAVRASIRPSCPPPTTTNSSLRTRNSMAKSMRSLGDRLIFSFQSYHYAPCWQTWAKFGRAQVSSSAVALCYRVLTTTSPIHTEVDSRVDDGLSVSTPRTPARPSTQCRSATAPVRHGDESLAVQRREGEAERAVPGYDAVPIQHGRAEAHAQGSSSTFGREP